MKKIKIILYSACILLMCNCDDRLEQIAPEDSLSSDVIFGSFSTIEAATVAVYDGFQDAGAFSETAFSGDFMADDVNFVGSFTTFQDIRDFDANSTNNTISGIWFDLWDVTRDANNIIVNLPPVAQSDVTFSNAADAANWDVLKQQFIAEARFGRALVYLTQANIFAQSFQVSQGSNLGLPIVTQFFVGDIEPFKNERSNLNETHAFIEADLLFAMSNLPSTNGVRATSASAKGLLSRLYLYREQWTDAANMANDVINTSGLSLAPDYSFYNTNSSEHVFQIINTADDPAFGSDFDTFYNPTSNNGRGDLTMTTDLQDAFLAQPGDVRYTDLTYDDTDAGNQPARFTAKYPNGATNESDPNVIRMAEMHLNRAEANFRGGTSIGDTPLNDVNAIRSRAGLTALTSVTLDDILLERRKELAFEGHRRMDLLRNGLNLKPDGGAISAPGAPKTIFPIPNTELIQNPNITQNPTY